VTEFFPKYNVFPRGVILALSFVMIAALLGGCATSFDKRGKFHRVRSGESIWTIARFYGLDLQELAEYNNIFKPGDMKAGQQLYIPEKEKKPPFKELPSDSSSRSSRRGGSKYSRADSSPSQIKTFRGKFIWPVEGRLTSPFGIRNGRRHDGIDIAAREGTPIKASAPGTAVFVGTMRGYGNLILLRHSDNFFTAYAHNQKNRIKKGDEVKQGQLIATVGRTGRATGSHLHFEIRSGQKARNPLFFLPERK